MPVHYDLPTDCFSCSRNTRPPCIVAELNDVPEAWLCEQCAEAFGTVVVFREALGREKVVRLGREGRLIFRQV